MDNKNTKMFVPDINKYAYENYNAFFNAEERRFRIQEKIEDAITISYIAAQKAGLPQEEIEKLAEKVDENIKNGNTITDINEHTWYCKPEEIIKRVWFATTIDAINEYTHDNTAYMYCEEEDETKEMSLIVNGKYIDSNAIVNDNDGIRPQKEIYENKEENPNSVISGTYANIDWRITADNELILGNGKEQTLASISEVLNESRDYKVQEKSFDGIAHAIYAGRLHDSLPIEYRNKIEKISFDGIVHTQSKMPNIFTDMKNVKEINLKGFDTKNLEERSMMFSKSKHFRA